MKTLSIAKLAGLIALLFLLPASALTVLSQNVIQGNWNTQADAYRGQNGQRFTFSFPAWGTVSSRVWGTDLYTDDCSIASAAVHAGLITAQSGGTVTIEIRAGAASYRGSTRNGVASKDYGAFSGSFVFVGSGSQGNPTPVAIAIQGNWNTQADAYRGQNGQRFTITFPGGGTVSSRVWGTDLYTDDCSIASAAVHAGLITPQSGGTVTIEIRPGAAAYRGSTRNGVASKDYGAFSGSFVFVGSGSQVNPTPPANAIQGTWGTQADAYRGRNGQRFTFTFPGGGAVSGRVWGTDLYTDDCSIASAAVHAGLITPQSGGTVTIEIRPGAASYRGSTRNGVVSKDYGAFSGSFVFVGSGSQVNPTPPANAIQGTWGTQADAYRGQNGQRFTFTFPGGGAVSGRVWGTDLYTDDCSIASAAVHAGLITPQSGGTVTIEIRPGAASYRGSTRNGVASKDYGAFSGSFVFVR